MKLLRYPQPNIFPGKKLKAEQFHEQRKHLQAWMSDIFTMAIDKDRYGLVYNKDVLNDELVLNGKLLEINNLAALAPSGIPILIKKGLSSALSLELPDHPSTENLEVYVIAEYDYCVKSSKSPFAPYSYPKYRLALNPLENTVEFELMDAVKIGEIVFKNDEYFILSTLPPTIHLKANNTLWAKFQTLKNDWTNFHKYNQQIIYLNSTQENTDRQSLYRFAEALDTYMSGIHARFNNLNERSHPQELFFIISGLANIIHSKLSTTYRKSQLLELMAKYTDTQGYRFLHIGFERGVDFSSKIYDHENLDYTMKNLRNFFDLVKIVWMRLSSATDHAPKVIPLTNSL